MKQTADAVVIGGGVMGASITYHLARAGVRRVTLLEKKHLCNGGTGKSTAVIRMHYENEPETHLAFASHATYAHFDDYIGGECGFVRTGVLWIVGLADADKLRANVAMHRRLGVNSQLVTPEEVKSIEPAYRVDDFALAAYEPDSGYADPLLTTFALARRARELGATIREGVAVGRIVASNSRVTGVETGDGMIESPIVINAAGCWAAPLAKTVGVEAPIVVQRNQVAVLRQPPDMMRQHACTADVRLGFYFRPDGSGATQIGAGAGQDGVDPDGYNHAVDADFVELAKSKVKQRVPQLERGVFRGGWSGIYDMTPDGKAILDRAGPEGFYLACGFSGTGFKKAPAVGKCLSEWIVEGQPRTVDLRPFRLSRWAEGQPLRGEHEYGAGDGHFWQSSQEGEELKGSMGT